MVQRNAPSVLTQALAGQLDPDQYVVRFALFSRTGHNVTCSLRCYGCCASCSWVLPACNQVYVREERKARHASRLLVNVALLADMGYGKRVARDWPLPA